MPSQQNFDLKRGNTFKFVGTVTKTSDGTAVNLTGGTMKMQARYPPGAGNAAGTLVFTCDSNTPDGITLTSPTTGVYTTVIALSKTSGLPDSKVILDYDVKFTDSASEVRTVLEGKIIITPNITA